MRIAKIQFFVLTLTLALVWLGAFQLTGSRTLRIVACDVGQGDAILIISGSSQILVDGGRGSSVLTCLGKYMPFWDREIELVVLTHPQADHYEGLINVFRSYKVNTFLANALESSNSGYQVLKSEVGGSQARVINPKEGMGLRVGMMYLDILHPTEEFIASNTNTSSYQSEASDNNLGVLGAYTTKLDPNDFSIVFILKYDKFSALFTGDMGLELSNEVAQKLGSNSNFVGLDYLKVPHHGSKNGLGESLVKVLQPKVAVISAGRENPYGHPHKEVLDVLKANNLTILRTDEMGDIILETRGEGFSQTP